MSERMETRLFREVARVNHQNAQLQQTILCLTAGEGKADPMLVAEWHGQEIAFKRMMNVIDGKDA